MGQDKSNKALLDQLNATNKKVDAANLTLGDYAMSKNKIANENAELFRIVGDLENNLNIIAKQKSALGAQLNDVKALCDNEARERQLLLGKFRNLEHELDGAKEALDEEAAGRDNILRLVAKAEGDAFAMRQKYEVEAVAKGEELEMTKMKLAARNSEAEATVDNLNAKLVQIEKAKSKIQGEINEMTASLDQAQVINAAMERKAKSFDKTITEMKGKVDRLSFDLDVSQKDTRNASSELFKVKSAYEERTKLFPMKSRISWIKSLKEEDPSMKLTKSESALRLKRWNCNLLLKKQRQPWSKRRTRSSGVRWSLLKLRLRLTAVLLRKMRNSEWLGKTRQKHWTPCNAPLKLKLRVRQKP